MSPTCWQNEDAEHAPPTHHCEQQSAFCVQPAAQRGCEGFVVVSQPWPSGQSEAVTQPTVQLFEPSGFDWHTWPLLQSASCAQRLRLKQALARHW